MSHASPRAIRLIFSGSATLAFSLALGACGSDENSGKGGVAPGSNSEAQTSSSPLSTTQTSTGSTGATGATSNTSGGSSSSTSSNLTGASGSSSTSSETLTGSSGSSGASGNTEDTDSASQSTITDEATVSSTNEVTDSDATNGSDSSGDETSDAPAECTRELLDGLLGDYLAALSTGDPSSLPLASTLKFTENAEEVEIGTTAFWMNAGETKHVQAALDTTQCSVAAQAVVPEGTTDLPIGIRIKVEGGEMLEIETIVVRQGDYVASFAVDSEPADIVTISDQIGWHDEVPEADRATREQLSAWVDKYFRAFPAGVCDVTTACRRLENGGGGNAGELGFSCQAGASCSNSNTSDSGFEPRVIVVDELRGIAAGFTIFDAFGTSGHLDMHMMKMSGGQVHAVHAILRDTAGVSGWD